MKFFLLTIQCFLLVSCATPAQRFYDKATEFGFSSQIIKSKKFQHTIYQTNTPVKNGVLHVYLDGDGTPWIRNRWVATDPTARNPLILRLMKLDTMPSLLLGRPCYYDLKHRVGCDNKYWTSHRYSRLVVDSMVSVLNQWLDKHKFKKVVLIGYSGGGSLAMLIAGDIQKVSKVVTVAANLDIAAWSHYHGYLTLKESLNPADEMLLSKKIKQYHFAGQDDAEVPASIIEEFANNQGNASFYKVEKQDHASNWESVWLYILSIINK